MPRGGGDADVRWFEIEPCYVFHPLNAYEDGTSIVIDVVRYAELWRGGPEDRHPAALHAGRSTSPPGAVSERQLDDRPVEFPRVDDRRTGLRHRYGYAVTNAEPMVGRRIDAAGQVRPRHRRRHGPRFRPGRTPAEASSSAGSAPRRRETTAGGRATSTTPPATRSDLVILDAVRFAGTAGRHDPSAATRPVRLPRQLDSCLAVHRAHRGPGLATM